MPSVQQVFFERILPVLADCLHKVLLVAGISAFVISPAQAQTASSVTLAASSLTAFWHEPVTLTASVQVPSGVAGTMTFMSGMSPASSDCIAIPVTVDSSGLATAQCVLEQVYMGPNYLRASFSPDSGNVQVGTSPDVIVRGVQFDSVVTINSSANPSQPGQDVTFTVSVAANATTHPTSGIAKAAPLPTGTVTLSEGASILGTASLDAVTGAATIPVNKLTTAGSHTLVARYNGDALYSAVQQSTAFTQTVLGTTSAVAVPLFGEWWEKALLSLMVMVFVALGMRGRWRT